VRRQQPRRVQVENRGHSRWRDSSKAGVRRKHTLRSFLANDVEQILIEEELEVREMVLDQPCGEFEALSS
jgi:hypothetical protein